MKREKTTSWGLTAGFLSLLAAFSVCDGGTVVVLSSDAKPYQDAAAALEERLTQVQQPVRRLSLNDVKKDFAAAVKGVEAFVAVGTTAAEWLHGNAADPSVGLIYCMVSDPEKHGLTQGRRAYGVTIQIPVKPQFDLIRECLPDARSIGMLTNSRSPNSGFLREAREALPAGWKLQTVEVDKYESVSKAIEALFAQNIDIVWTYPDASIYDTTTIRALLLASIRRKMPVFGFSLPFVRAGALLGVVVDSKSQGNQAAELAIRLLKEPSKNPVLSDSDKEGQIRYMPPQFSIAVNLIVAEKLSLKVPASVTKQAEHVFGRE